MMDFKDKDEYLEERMTTYDAWLVEGKIPTSSKVIPIHESVDALQWVLPTNQVVEILRNSRSFAVVNCSCRTRYQRCANPLEVCFFINDAADRCVKKGEGRYIGLEEATEKLKLANKHGLVHLTIYNPEQHIYALCSCCQCRCHDIQIMKKYHRPNFITHSDYLVDVNRFTCIECGECVTRCVFGAQEQQDVVVYKPEKCYGCGLCLTACPTNSITLKLRNPEKTDLKGANPPMP